MSFTKLRNRQNKLSIHRKPTPLKSTDVKSSLIYVVTKPKRDDPVEIEVDLEAAHEEAVAADLEVVGRIFLKNQLFAFNII